MNNQFYNPYASACCCHANAPAVVPCNVCGRGICDDCYSEFGENICVDCLEHKVNHDLKCFKINVIAALVLAFLFGVLFFTEVYSTEGKSELDVMIEDIIGGEAETADAALSAKMVESCMRSMLNMAPVIMFVIIGGWYYGFKLIRSYKSQFGCIASLPVHIAIWLLSFFLPFYIGPFVTIPMLIKTLKNRDKVQKMRAACRGN